MGRLLANPVRARLHEGMNQAVKVPHEDAVRPLFSYKPAFQKFKNGISGAPGWCSQLRV